MLEALKEKYVAQIIILYAEGVKITDTDAWAAPTIKLGSVEENKKQIAEAVEVAKQAELFVGSNAFYKS